MLSLLLITPLIGCFIISSINTTNATDLEINSKLKKIALFFSVLTLIISIKL
jgi:hypothetical protein